jgi:hypothetical protein
MHLQAAELLGGELEEKVDREAFAVAPHLLIQACSRDSIERGKIVIQEHALAAQRLSEILCVEPLIND